MNKRLQRFYEMKHKLQSETISTQNIPYVKYPKDRYQACIRYFINNFKEGNILEIASGSGRVAQSLLSYLPNINEFTVSELNETRLQGLRCTFSDSRVRCISLDVENIRDTDIGRYDAVIMLAVIELLIDPLEAMKKISIFLKKGGLIYLSTPNVAKYTNRLKLLFGRFPSTGSKNEGLMTEYNTPVDLFDEGHLHYFTHRSLSVMLKQYCGFSRIEYITHFYDKSLFGDRIGHFLARQWPGLFSELSLIAHMD
jgi:2-polyprenyl-3-methyl-5-hydroxy-6-metoxy-1,4-benzoquinol methylase